MTPEIINKKIKGSNRMVEPNWLIPSYNFYNKKKYLNVSVDSNDSAGLAEWLLQLVDTKSSSFRGLVGSIPTPGAVFSSFYNVQKLNKVILI